MLALEDPGFTCFVPGYVYFAAPVFNARTGDWGKWSHQTGCAGVHVDPIAALDDLIRAIEEKNGRRLDRNEPLALVRVAYVSPSWTFAESVQATQFPKQNVTYTIDVPFMFVLPQRDRIICGELFKQEIERAGSNGMPRQVTERCFRKAWADLKR